MTINSKNKVILYQINSPKEKLIKIVQTTMHYFERREKFLIKVQNDIALKFVDELLWKQPPESFLPHVTSEKQVDDYIVITKSSKNLNNAKYMFNLSNDLFEIDLSFKVIYDFDENNLKNKKDFLKKFEIYKNAKYIIESK